MHISFTAEFLCVWLWRMHENERKSDFNILITTYLIFCVCKTINFKNVRGIIAYIIIKMYVWIILHLFSLCGLKLRHRLWNFQETL